MNSEIYTKQIWVSILFNHNMLNILLACSICLPTCLCVYPCYLILSDWSCLSLSKEVHQSFCLTSILLMVYRGSCIQNMATALAISWRSWFICPDWHTHYTLCPAWYPLHDMSLTIWHIGLGLTASGSFIHLCSPVGPPCSWTSAGQLFDKAVGATDLCYIGIT